MTSHQLSVTSYKYREWLPVSDHTDPQPLLSRRRSGRGEKMRYFCEWNYASWLCLEALRDWLCRGKSAPFVVTDVRRESMKVEQLIRFGCYTEELTKTRQEGEDKKSTLDHWKDTHTGFARSAAGLWLSSRDWGRARISALTVWTLCLDGRLLKREPVLEQTRLDHISKFTEDHNINVQIWGI